MLIFDLHTIGNKLLTIRKHMGMTQAEVAEAAGLSDRTYADIERGSCGMSVETLMAISSTLNLTLEYVIYGKTSSEKEQQNHTDEVCAILDLLNNSSGRKRKYALQMLKLFLVACDGLPDEESN